MRHRAVSSDTDGSSFATGTAPAQRLGRSTVRHHAPAQTTTVSGRRPRNVWAGASLDTTLLPNRSGGSTAPRRPRNEWPAGRATCGQGHRWTPRSCPTVPGGGPRPASGRSGSRWAMARRAEPRHDRPSSARSARTWSRMRLFPPPIVSRSGASPTSPARTRKVTAVHTRRASRS